MSDLLESLPSPTALGAFKKLDESDAFETLLPTFECDAQGTPQRVIGLLLYLNKNTHALAYNPDDDGWVRVDQTTRTNTVFNDVDDFFERHVTIVDSDRDDEITLYKELKAKLQDFYGDVFIEELDELEPEAQRMFTEDELSFSCTCESLDQQEYLPIAEDVWIRRCDGCTSLPGVRFQGDDIPTETVLSAEWITSGEASITSGEANAWEDGNQVIVSPEGVLNRTDIAMYLVGLAAMLTDYRMTPYNHEAFSGLVVLRDGEMAGYATWNTAFDGAGTPVLRQMYVRPEYRGQGVGTQLIQARVATAVGDEYDQFYVDDPNDAGWSVYQKLGYAEGEAREKDQPRAVPVRVLEPQNAYPEGRPQGRK